MDDQAWPFLLGRTRTQDHRIVVIPDFMAAGALVSALRSPVDSGPPGSPESVQAREIETSPGHRVTVIYRVNVAHADSWGMVGERVLTDEHGRPIVLTEGLVVCRPATAVQQNGITQEDLDLAHSLVVPAYLEFWAQGPDYARQTAKSFRLAMSGKQVPINPHGSPIPWVSEHPEAPQPPKAVAPRGTERTEDNTAGPVTYLPAGADTPVPVGSAAPTATGGHRSRKGTAAMVAVGVAVVVIAIAVLLATRLLQGPGPTSPASNPARTMTMLCNALQSGDPGHGYATTTSAYQHGTTEKKFVAELLPLGKTTPIRCTYRLHANPGPTTASAAMTVAEGPRARSWLVTLTKASGSTWRVSAIR
jgi:hypothetical protein